MLAVASHPVEGRVSRGFEAVREAFAENFTRRRELGGACCAYYRGELEGSSDGVLVADSKHPRWDWRSAGVSRSRWAARGA
jgi:predicted neuraminidase